MSRLVCTRHSTHMLCAVHRSAGPLWRATYLFMAAWQGRAGQSSAQAAPCLAGEGQITRATHVPPRRACGILSASPAAANPVVTTKCPDRMQLARIRKQPGQLFARLRLCSGADSPDIKIETHRRRRAGLPVQDGQ